MPAPANLVHQTSTTTGTGNQTLAAVNGKNSFDNAFGHGATTNVFDYFISNRSADEWERGTGHMSDATTLARDTVIESTNANAAVNFSVGVKDVTNDVPATKQLRNEAQTLTETERAVARSNINAAPFDALAFNNIAVNGGVDVSQELGTTGATLTNNTVKNIADCWKAMYNHGAATAVVTSAQLAASSFPAVLPGFKFGHQIKATTAITSPANGDFAKHSSKIEGYRIAHLGWGATGAGAIVVAFQFYSTASGTAFVKLSNSDQSRCYYHEITVATGWNFYAFSVPGDTSGTWQATTSAGLVFEIFSAGTETTPASSLDAWGSTNKGQTTNSTNLLGTANNLTILTGLYIAAGTQVPTSSDLPRLMRPLDQELVLCMRYFEKSYNYETAVGAATTVGMLDLRHRATVAGIVLTSEFAFFKVIKRTSPTVIVYDPMNANTTGISDNGTTTAPNGITTGVQLFNWFISPYSGTVGNYYRWHYTADARL